MRRQRIWTAEGRSRRGEGQDARNDTSPVRPPWYQTSRESDPFCSYRPDIRLPHAGTEIHVFQLIVLHTKVPVIDAEFVSAGSINFDMHWIRIDDPA